MSTSADRTADSRPLADLLASLGLSNEQAAAVLDAWRREHQELRASLAGVHETGLGPAPGARILPLREAERRHLVAALRQTGGKIYGRDGAAKLLELKPTTLQSKLKKHGISRLDAAGAGEVAGGSGAGPASEVPGDLTRRAAE